MNSVPAFTKSYDFYKHLYLNLRLIPKRDRYTWGEKCDILAIDLLKFISQAEFAPKTQKRPLLEKASENIDLIKIYLRLGHDLKILDQKKYIAREYEILEVGKMIGSWKSSV